MELSFPDISSAKRWVTRNQLGRRNLTPAEVSYYSGLHYRAEKGPIGRPKGEENVVKMASFRKRPSILLVTTVLMNGGFAATPSLPRRRTALPRSPGTRFAVRCSPSDRLKEAVELLNLQVALLVDQGLP